MSPRLERLAMRCAAWPASLMTRVLLRTSRRPAHRSGEEALAALLDDQRSFIPCSWHRRVLPVSAFLISRLRERGVRPTFLVSLSRDGELGSSVLRSWGADSVRGSTSRGGRQALTKLRRRLKEDGQAVFLAPDGPRGPAHEAQLGAVVLAQVSGAPLLPMGAALTSAWTLRSWDRLLVPKPGSRVAITIGEPIEVPLRADADELEHVRGLLQGSLDQQVDEARRLLAAGG
ncbi:MAG: lysophospholipid acyltransferase family protein [Acidobacteriota bacterium]